MAPFPPLPAKISKQSPFSLVIIVTFFFFLLLHCPCHGYRLRKSPSYQRPQTSFVVRGRAFDFLPRGIPIPPSGPSKRHDSMVDSTNLEETRSP